MAIGGQEAALGWALPGPGGGGVEEHPIHHLLGLQLPVGPRGGAGLGRGHRSGIGQRLCSTLSTAHGLGEASAAGIGGAVTGTAAHAVSRGVMGCHVPFLQLVRCIGEAGQP
jgi:hypothetical protein